MKGLAKLLPLLLVGVVLGLAGGLVYAWVIAPVRYYDTYPPLLEAPYRRDWIHMAAVAYGLEGNLSRTQLRLLNLPQAELRAASLAALERGVDQGYGLEMLRRMAELASHYGAEGAAVEIYADPELTAAPAATPTPSPTATLPSPTPVPPTLTPSPTPVPPPVQTPGAPASSPYEVVTQTLSCAPQALLAVTLEVSGSVSVRGRDVPAWVPAPGRELWLIWDEGADRAITGLRPANGAGYADFALAPARTYHLYVARPVGLPISTFQVEPCTPEEGEGWVARTLLIRERAIPEQGEATPAP